MLPSMAETLGPLYSCKGGGGALEEDGGI